jgi:hypothetical protein
MAGSTLQGAEIRMPTHRSARSGQSTSTHNIGGEASAVFFEGRLKGN